MDSLLNSISNLIQVGVDFFRVIIIRECGKKEDNYILYRDSKYCRKCIDEGKIYSFIEKENSFICDSNNSLHNIDKGNYIDDSDYEDDGGFYNS